MLTKQQTTWIETIESKDLFAVALGMLGENRIDKDTFQEMLAYKLTKGRQQKETALPLAYKE